MIIELFGPPAAENPLAHAIDDGAREDGFDIQLM